MRPKALLVPLLDCSGTRIAELGRHNSAALPGVKYGTSSAKLSKPHLGASLEVARSAPPTGRLRVAAPDRAKVACLKRQKAREASVPAAYRVIRVDDASYPYPSASM